MYKIKTDYFDITIDTFSFNSTDRTIVCHRKGKLVLVISMLDKRTGGSAFTEEHYNQFKDFANEHNRDIVNLNWLNYVNLKDSEVEIFYKLVNKIG